MDDQIRIRIYRAIYGNSNLAPYSLRAVPPIHIIVNGGHVTLEGAVESVPNVFSVTNKLTGG